MARILFLAPLFAVIAVGVYFVFLKSPPPLPEMNLEEHWGPESLRNKKDESIRPFKIKFDNIMIKDLKDAIKLTRDLTPPLEGINFEYGFNSNVLKDWLTYWKDEYNFEERAKFFNKYQSYKTLIQGLKIHFVHVKPEVPAGTELVPVLLLHGWPGSVREFYEAIPYLTAVDSKRNYALELIIPSLPGYGFSDAAVRPGLGSAEVAVIMKNLMNRLGYKQYYIQGGDWGSIIGSYIATLFPEEVLGYHTNLPMASSAIVNIIQAIASIYPPLIMEPELVDRLYPLSEKLVFYLLEETGYMHIQSTKPDTVGVALTDSPAGLLAYILEKFSTWTNKAYRSDPTGGLTNYFTKEQLIDNIMVYWSTSSITTSVRLYSESFNKRQLGLGITDYPTYVPTWALQAKHEISYQPPFILRFKYPNLLNATVLDDGGHFIAMQLPKVFSEDVIRAIGEFRKWHQNSVKTEL